MKKFIFTLISFVHLSLFGQFEGVFTMNTINNETNEKSKISWYAAKTAHRMDIETTTEYGMMNMTLFFVQQGSTVKIISQGQTIELPVSSLQPVSSVKDFFMAQPTGKSENIAGYDCKEYKLIASNGTAICMVAENMRISNFPTAGIFQTLQIQGINGLPLKIKVADLKGNQIYSQEITSITEQNISNDLFDIR
jgi:hypothetical protein